MPSMSAGRKKRHATNTKLAPRRLSSLAWIAGATSVSRSSTSSAAMLESSSETPAARSPAPRSAHTPPSQLPTERPARITPMIAVQVYRETPT